MNILTIPLAAVSAFSLFLAYAHLHGDAADAGAAAPISADVNQAKIHVHDESTQPRGKPAAAIALIGEGVQTLELQRPAKLNLQLHNDTGEGTVTVAIATDQALQLLSKQQQWSFPAAQTPVINLPLELVAHRNGAHRLHLFIEHEARDGEVTPRAMAVQFNVGEGDSTTLYTKHASAAADHPAVIRLPAHEEIINL